MRRGRPAQVDPKRPHALQQETGPSSFAGQLTGILVQPLARCSIFMIQVPARKNVINYSYRPWNSGRR